MSGAGLVIAVMLIALAVNGALFLRLLWTTRKERDDDRDS